MIAFSWRQVAAAWAVVLVLSLLAVGGFALVPGLDTAHANPPLRSIASPQQNPALDRASSEEFDAD
jgi:hypothetical protein